MLICSLKLILFALGINCSKSFKFFEGLSRGRSLFFQNNQFANGKEFRVSPSFLSLQKQQYFTEEANSKVVLDPQVISTGFSNKVELTDALSEALESAIHGLPPAQGDNNKDKIDLCLVFVSSLYDGSSSSTPINVVAPYLTNRAKAFHGRTISHLLGCTAGGIVSSSLNWDNASADLSGEERSKPHAIPLEAEGIASVSITLMKLPDVSLSTFHVKKECVPDQIPQQSDYSWLDDAGLDRQVFDPTNTLSPFHVLLISSPSFQTKLESLLSVTPKAFGGVASTVSLLSRPRLFRYSFDDASTEDFTTYADGCLGVTMNGDLEIDIVVSQGAKPVGPTYRVVAAEGSTIRAMRAESDANSQVPTDESKRVAVPRPPLAEANYLLKKVLSDDDAAFMKKTLLIGVENTCLAPNHDCPSYSVFEVVSAGAKDGSATLPLGCVDLTGGERIRFFVRETLFAQEEVHSNLQKYCQNTQRTHELSGCLMLPTLDRGTNLLGSKPGFESSSICESLPRIPSISGFFNNGVIVPRQKSLAGASEKSVIHGSGTCLVFFRSKLQRPVFCAIEEKKKKSSAETESTTSAKAYSKKSILEEVEAPRSDDGELILKRREIHSGRAISVSTVQWSVAEKTATPTSALEGWMWDKEAEVDRFRERVPLANLLSQLKLSAMTKGNEQKDWAGTVCASESFAIVPEAKRSDLTTGSLRLRYMPDQLIKQWEESGLSSAVSVNCDSVIFGGSLDDLSMVKEISSVPVLASDLVLYPYQLYQLRLANADAVSFVAASLPSKDLAYLIKIAASVGLQAVVVVTSQVQIDRVVSDVSNGLIKGLIVSNRRWEDGSVDETGEQALRLLRSDSLSDFRQKFGDSVPVLADGGVGSIERSGSYSRYIRELQDAGAKGAIIGRALAVESRMKEIISEFVKK